MLNSPFGHSPSVARISYSLTHPNASAIIYSLVETAKMNQLNVYQYFKLLLTEIPKHMDDKNLSSLDDLLPWSPTVLEKYPSRFKKS